MEAVIYIELDYKDKTYSFYVLACSDMYHLIFKIITILSVPLHQLCLLYRNSINLLDEKTFHMLQSKKTQCLSDYFNQLLKIKLKAELKQDNKPNKILKLKMNDNTPCQCKKSNAEFIVRTSMNFRCRLCYSNRADQKEFDQYFSINQSSYDETIKDYLRCLKKDADDLIKKYESISKSGHQNDNCRIDLLIRDLNYKLTAITAHVKELVYFFSDELIYCCNELFNIEKLLIQIDKVVKNYVLASSFKPNMKDFSREINERLKDLADLAGTIVKQRRPEANFFKNENANPEEINSNKIGNGHNKINIYNNFNISIHTGSKGEVSSLQNQLITQNIINDEEINQINSINLNINNNSEFKKSKFANNNSVNIGGIVNLKFNEVFKKKNPKIVSPSYKTMTHSENHYDSTIEDVLLLSPKMPSVISVLRSPTIERCNFPKVAPIVESFQRRNSKFPDSSRVDSGNSSQMLQNIKNYYSIRKRDLSKYNKSVFEKLVFKN